ncbi:MAG: phage tail protein [Rhodospirillaceae bacterium]|nr:phage tail protein [Rhodospirillales bacterium]
MNKLASLRDAILNCPLKIKADKLLTWAEKGQVLSVRGTGNKAFQITYTAKAVVVDYAGAPHDLLFVAVDWLHRDNPAAAEDAITFTADIISAKAADVELAVEITEIIAVRTNPDGTVSLVPVGDPDAQALDMGAFYAALNASG